MDQVHIEHTATIYGSEGDLLSVEPYEEGLIRLTYHDGDTDPVSLILSPGMALALTSTISRVVSLNTPTK